MPTERFEILIPDVPPLWKILAWLAFLHGFFHVAVFAGLAVYHFAVVGVG